MVINFSELSLDELDVTRIKCVNAIEQEVATDAVVGFYGSQIYINELKLKVAALCIVTHVDYCDVERKINEYFLSVQRNRVAGKLSLDPEELSNYNWLKLSFETLMSSPRYSIPGTMPFGKRKGLLAALAT